MNIPSKKRILIWLVSSIVLLSLIITFVSLKLKEDKNIQTFSYEDFSDYYNVSYGFELKYDANNWKIDNVEADLGFKEMKNFLVKSKNLKTDLIIKIVDQGYINSHTSRDALALNCKDYLDSAVISTDPSKLSRLKTEEGWIYAFGEYNLKENSKICEDKLYQIKTIAATEDTRRQISLRLEVRGSTSKGLSEADEIAKQLFSAKVEQ